MPVVSSMVGGEKPSRMREVMRGMYWYQRPRLLARILMRKYKCLAYDWRGNFVAKSEEELSSTVDALGGFDRGLYAKKSVPFVKELALIVARGRDNSISEYPVETIHRLQLWKILLRK